MSRRIVVTFMAAPGIAAAVRAQSLPAFKVAARSSTAVILLVAPTTRDAELENLVKAIRTARTNNGLGTFIPPTTPGGSKGPYGIVMLFIMSDPTWATAPHLKGFINPTTSGISATEKEFGKRIRAYYYYTGLMNQEFGTIGYEDEGHTYTTTYKKLF